MDKQPFVEHWIGMWKKEGHTYLDVNSYINPFTTPHDKVLKLRCSFCSQKEKLRDQRIIKLYRVKNHTKQDSYWPWWDGTCENPNGCWGSQNRYWTVLRTNTGQWVFRTQVSELNTPTELSNIDELRLNLVQGQGIYRLRYSGIATGRHCNSFLPLITSQREHPARKIVIHMQSGEPMPDNPSLKQEFGTLSLMFPNHILMRFFEQPKIQLSSGIWVDDKPNYPKTEQDLESYWKEISRQYIFMYPGGAGARIEQYLKIDENAEVKKRRESSFLPLWWENEYSAYIPGDQSGWIGPISSVYSRIDAKHRKFW